MSHALPSRALRSAPQPAQRGVTLLVVLVMLVVIGFVSVSAMRRAATADLVTNNTRMEQLAKQAAESALKYCEAEIQKKPTPGINVQAADKNAWNTFSNWSDKAIVATVPDTFLQFDGSAKAPKTAPQCMAEYSPLGNKVYIITARGFSPDYQQTDKGETKAGSVVWLQSIVSTT